jgi:hypothetical protein
MMALGTRPKLEHGKVMSTSIKDAFMNFKITTKRSLYVFILYKLNLQVSVPKNLGGLGVTHYYKKP